MTRKQLQRHLEAESEKKKTADTPPAPVAPQQEPPAESKKKKKKTADTPPAPVAPQQEPPAE